MDGMKGFGRPGDSGERRRLWPAGVGVIIMIMLVGGQVQNIESQVNDGFAAKRALMVERDLKGRDVTDPRVLEAMGEVKRHEFVPPGFQDEAYGDYPIPIGEGQTISQPYIVAFMTQVLALKPGENVLEIGTGSGYQAAVLSHFTDRVYTIEINEHLAASARERLMRLGYPTVVVKHGDGYQGWRVFAPFDAIIITAAVDPVPGPLIQQLKEGGRIVFPRGKAGSVQELVKIVKTNTGLETLPLFPVRFVPMVGDALKQ